MRNTLRLPVSRLAALACLVAMLALGSAACGSSDSDSSDFPKGYNAAIAKLDRAGTELSTTQPTGKTRSSRAIARQLERFADLLAGTSRDLARLEPPKAATTQFSALRRALDRSIASARQAARAARQIQPARQRRALRQLRDDVVEVARAQDALQRAIAG
jgi:acyl-CoA reductase-like NAD-dependent aldehyde dehydrogenase